MRKAIPVLAALGLIAVVVLGAVGVTFIQRYTPSKEAADLSEVWNVEGNEIALLYNYELQETKGLYENGESYLPISWVNEHINKRFYWDEGEQLLVYALPDQIVYADLSTMGSSGAPLLLLKENEVYLTLGLVSNYTNVQISAFDSAAAAAKPSAVRFSEGWPSQALLLSHHWQRTLHPKSLIKYARRPACSHSPCQDKNL